MDLWGNASSIHWTGRGPKALLREARQSVAQALGVDSLEIVFTSGGSEANNLAIKGVLPETPKDGRDEILISAVEHPSVFKTALSMRERGYRIVYLNVDRSGQMDLSQLDEKLNERTALVSVMLANNETGHLFPVATIAKRAHQVGALLHCDAVQALGKIPLDLRSLDVDLASLSGHKFYSLKGVGALFVRKGVQLTSLIHGGGQERGRRAGTENTLAIASLGFMCQKTDQIMPEALRLRELRDYLESELVRRLDQVQITGADSSRLPGTSNMLIGGIDGETLLMNLDVAGFAVSTGAACSSGNPEPSPVLLAMGHSREEAQRSLRISLGWGNSKEDVEALVEEVVKTVARLRSFKHGVEFSYGV